MPSHSIVSSWPETSPRRLLLALTVVAALGLAVPAVSESRPQDRDGDGLTNRVELRKTHTNPRRADTDSDGLTDTAEVRKTHTNPRRADTDRDGLTDAVEVRKTRTSPRRADTDGDGSSDALEVLSGTSPRQTQRKKPKLVVPPPSDTTPPETSISSGPSGTVTESSASFAFGSSEAGSTFQCRQDGGAWGACSSPKAYFALANGAHTFDVRATDAAGNTDGSPASHAWTVDVPPPPPADTTPPETSIGSGPSGTVATGSASFSFDSSESGSTFSCRMDGGSWSSCSSPREYAELANGSHTFDVRATDGAGNVDGSPATRTWTVNVPPPLDTTAPNTTIDSGPSGTVASGSATFGFSSSEAGSSFQCRLDGGSWGACSSPKSYSGLVNGSHAFDVRATDGAGNTDGSPATRTWTVNVPPPDTTVPNTTLDSGPSGTVASGLATFGFSSSEAGSSFQCRLDGGSWGACSSPKSYSGLTNGSHSFDVRATDAAGNTDASPASRSWTVNVPPAPPSGAISVAPGGDLTAAYNAAQAGGVIELSTGNYGAWDTPVGSKQITIRAKAGERPVLRRLGVFADNVTFDGLDIDAAGGTPSCGGGNGGTCPAFGTHGTSNVTFKNGRIGNVVDEKGALLGGETEPTPLNVTLDNVEFHDVRQVTAGVHNECVFSQVPGLTIRNSTFTNCATMDLFITLGEWWGQQPYGHITLENNVFGHSVNGSGWHYYGLYWSSYKFESVRVVNNTFENSVILGNIGAGPYSGVWANNLGGGWSCLSGVTYRNNVGKACDPSDKAASPMSSCGPPACSSLITAPYKWVNPAADDFHLLAGSPAIDTGSAQYAPPLDRDGKARNGPPDAGAYEF